MWSPNRPVPRRCPNTRSGKLRMLRPNAFTVTCVRRLDVGQFRKHLGDKNFTAAFLMMASLFLSKAKLALLGKNDSGAPDAMRSLRISWDLVQSPRRSSSGHATQRIRKLVVYCPQLSSCSWASEHRTVCAGYLLRYVTPVKCFRFWEPSAVLSLGENLARGSGHSVVGTNWFSASDDIGTHRRYHPSVCRMLGRVRTSDFGAAFGTHQRHLALLPLLVLSDIRCRDASAIPSWVYAKGGGDVLGSNSVVCCCSGQSFGSVTSGHTGGCTCCWYAHGLNS